MNLPSSPLYDRSYIDNYTEYTVIFSLSEYYESVAFAGSDNFRISFGDYSNNRKMDFRDLVGYYFEYPLSKIYKPTGSASPYFFL